MNLRKVLRGCYLVLAKCIDFIFLFYPKPIHFTIWFRPWALTIQLYSSPEGRDLRGGMVNEKFETHISLKSEKKTSAFLNFVAYILCTFDGTFDVEPKDRENPNKIILKNSFTLWARTIALRVMTILQRKWYQCIFNISLFSKRINNFKILYLRNLLGPLRPKISSYSLRSHIKYHRPLNEARSCYFQSYKFFLLLQKITFSILIWNSKKIWGSPTFFAHFRPLSSGHFI